MLDAALAREPDRRPTAAELAARLEAVVKGGPEPRRGRRVLVALGLGAAFAVVLGVALALRGATPSTGGSESATGSPRARGPGPPTPAAPEGTKRRLDRARADALVGELLRVLQQARDTGRADTLLARRTAKDLAAEVADLEPGARHSVLGRLADEAWAEARSNWGRENGSGAVEELLGILQASLADHDAFLSGVLAFVVSGDPGKEPDTALWAGRVAVFERAADAVAPIDSFRAAALLARAFQADVIARGDDAGMELDRRLAERVRPAFEVVREASRHPPPGEEVFVDHVRQLLDRRGASLVVLPFRGRESLAEARWVSALEEALELREDLRECERVDPASALLDLVELTKVRFFFLGPSATATARDEKRKKLVATMRKEEGELGTAGQIVEAALRRLEGDRAGARDLVRPLTASDDPVVRDEAQALLVTILRETGEEPGEQRRLIEAMHRTHAKRGHVYLFGLAPDTIDQIAPR